MSDYSDAELVYLKELQKSIQANPSIQAKQKVFLERFGTKEQTALIQKLL
jgi:hypothetical protein